MIAPALVLTLMSALHPSLPRVASAGVIAAIAEAADTPYEASLLATWCWRESWCQEHPAPQSWDARALVSCGPWQLRCPLSRSPLEDARTWLSLYYDGERTCPASPAAPLSGGCTGAGRRIADSRMRDVWRALQSVGVASAQGR